VATRRGPCAPGEQYRALRFAAAPVLVWVASQGAFELLAFDLSDIAARLAEAARANAQHPRPATEAAARLLWAASLLLFLLAAGSVLGYAAWLWRAHVTGRAWRGYAVAALILCTGSLAHAAIAGWQQGAFSMIYFFTFDALVACGCYSAPEIGAVDTAVTTLNVLAAVVPPAALVAGCSALALPHGEDAGALAAVERSMARLRTVLAGGSALLVTGVLHQVAWHRWPLTLLEDRGELPGLVAALGLYWGVTYSLVIVAFYAPPAWVLHRHAARLLARKPELAAPLTPAHWLEEHGLSHGALHRLPQIAAVVAPALAGPLGAVATGLGEAVFLR